jgi:hypothetical protein
MIQMKTWNYAEKCAKYSIQTDYASIKKISSTLFNFPSTQLNCTPLNSTSNKNLKHTIYSHSSHFIKVNFVATILMIIFLIINLTWLLCIEVGFTHRCTNKHTSGFKQGFTFNFQKRYLIYLFVMLERKQVNRDGTYIIFRRSFWIF